MKGNYTWTLRVVALLGVLQQIHPFVISKAGGNIRLRNAASLHSVSVPVSELEKDLTPAERSITSVARKCGPSVGFVTSVWPSQQGTRRRRGAAPPPKEKNGLPQGMSLGTGSGFMVAPGYLCTNFHVIERAFTLQDNAQAVNDVLDQVAGNLTDLLPTEIINTTKTLFQRGLRPILEDLPEVYVRVSSSTQYQKCRIVDVEPDLDLAVLKIVRNIDANEDMSSTVSFGSSSELLVGQTVVAIGNPFGLDSTVTTGVVSAVNREFQAGTARTRANRPIRNCIQTDAAINPGNSGGPLLNLKGDVVGINTAIITTSGSNAGIGFAVPADQLRSIVDRIIREDQAVSGTRPDIGFLGVSVVTQKGSNSTLFEKNWVTSVTPGSPAAEAGIRPIKILENGGLEWGDAIINVGGTDVATFEELRAELLGRIKGEQLAVTLEDVEGEKRIVYVTLAEKPAT